MNEMIPAAILIIGGPVYAYFVLRMLASAVIRSYFEIKKEFIKWR